MRVIHSLELALRDDDASDSPHQNDPLAEDAERGHEHAPRLRFEGIVEAQNANRDAGTAQRDETRWPRFSRQVQQASRLVAVFIFFSYVAGPPLGDYLAHRTVYGGGEGWNFINAYSGNFMILGAVIVPLLVLLIGYALSRIAVVMNAAEALAAAAETATARASIDPATRITTMHDGVDSALTRLADVEGMIRKHVEAIELAGDAIEQKATNAVSRLVDERAELMRSTEDLHSQADAFAKAIAARADAAADAPAMALPEIDEEYAKRLARLEDAARRAIDRFDALREALVSSLQSFEATTQTIEDAARMTEDATDKATKAANAAAEAAAQNAANVLASATQATTASRDAAEQAIKNAGADVDRIAAAAITAAQDGADKIRQATRTAAQGEADAAAEEMASQNAALTLARKNLAEENARLESLIEEQRQRADTLAAAIASQTEKLTKLAETQMREADKASEAANLAAAAPTQNPSAPGSGSNQPRPKNPARKAPGNRRPAPTSASKPSSQKGNSAKPLGHGKTDAKGAASWRDILNAADEADPLLINKSEKTPPDDQDAQQTMAPKTKKTPTDDPIDIIAGLQDFVASLEQRLYGPPPPSLAERYAKGDRNVFANRLLRLNESDVKKRIRAETAKDREFEKDVQAFLKKFESLLEQATASETADEDLEAYLNAPLGRVYLLIGSTVGYFA